MQAIVSRILEGKFFLLFVLLRLKLKYNGVFGKTLYFCFLAFKTENMTKHVWIKRYSYSKYCSVGVWVWFLKIQDVLFSPSKQKSFVESL